MAKAVLTTSRRTLLGALAVLPIAAIPSPANASPSRWGTALARTRNAQTEHATAEATFSEAWKAYTANRPVRPGASEFMIGDTVETYNARLREVVGAFERADKACRDRFGVEKSAEGESIASVALDETLDELLEIPAPDLRAVATKLELAREMGDLAPILTDLRRLGGNS